MCHLKIQAFFFCLVFLLEGPSSALVKVPECELVVSFSVPAREFSRPGEQELSPGEFDEQMEPLLCRRHETVAVPRGRTSFRDFPPRNLSLYFEGSLMGAQVPFAHRDHEYLRGTKR